MHKKHLKRKKFFTKRFHEHKKAQNHKKHLRGKKLLIYLFAFSAFAWLHFVLFVLLVLLVLLVFKNSFLNGLKPIFVHSKTI